MYCTYKSLHLLMSGSVKPLDRRNINIVDKSITFLIHAIRKLGNLL